MIIAEAANYRPPYTLRSGEELGKFAKNGVKMLLQVLYKSTTPTCRQERERDVKEQAM